jgi:hypothetical protein
MCLYWGFHCERLSYLRAYTYELLDYFRTHLRTYCRCYHTDTQQFFSLIKQLYTVLPIYLMKPVYIIQPSFVETEGGIITPPRSPKSGVHWNRYCVLCNLHRRLCVMEIFCCVCLCLLAICSFQSFCFPTPHVRTYICLLTNLYPKNTLIWAHN